MFILKAFVNDKQIKEIHVQCIDVDDSGYHIYRIRKPTGTYNDIMHWRKDGWLPLSIKILLELEQADLGRFDSVR